MLRRAQFAFVTTDIETAQPIDQRPRNLANRDMTPPVVAIGQPIDQRRRRGGEGHFEVQGKRIVVDSGHSAIRRTKTEH